MKIFGSSSDIACRFGSSGASARACARPDDADDDADRQEQPADATAREFIASRICSDGSRV